MDDVRKRIEGPLQKLGYFALADLFIEQPTLNLFTAAEQLSARGLPCVPVHIGEALREGCEQKDDLHFFARVTLFTAFTGFNVKGWRADHWMIFGLWSGMLGPGRTDAATLSWDYLKGQKLELGWMPNSIYDPVLEEALKRGFGRRCRE